MLVLDIVFGNTNHHFLDYFLDKYKLLRAMLSSEQLHDAIDFVTFYHFLGFHSSRITVYDDEWRFDWNSVDQHGIIERVYANNQQCSQRILDVFQCEYEWRYVYI